MARPAGQLQRSLAALTIGMAQGQAARTRGLADTVTGEYLQQVHVPISGNASDDSWAFVDTPVAWELPFLYAPLQRRVPYLTPHFTYGIEMTAGQGALVIVHAHVIGWAVTDAGWTTGATVRFASSLPGTTDLTSWAAVAHLSFEGWATMPETGEFAR